MRDKKGIALVMILIFLFLISALIMENTLSSNLQLELITSSRAYLQAYSLAWGGVNYGLGILSKDEDLKIDWLGEEWAKGPFILEEGEGKVKIWIEDEMGKVDVNILEKAKGKEKRDRIEQLLELCDLLNTSYSFVPALIDWIDADGEVTVLPFITGENAGAEDEYYTYLPNPYPAKNLPLDVPEEILWIKGMNKELWEGNDEMQGWKELITIWGSGKVNLNTCPSPVFRATLQVYSSEAIDDALIEEIIEMRRDTPLSRVDDLSPYLQSKVISHLRKSSLLGFSSSLFRIKSEAEVEGVKVYIESVWERKMDGFRVKYVKVE